MFTLLVLEFAPRVFFFFRSKLTPVFFPTPKKPKLTKSQPVNELSIEKKKLIKTILKFIILFPYLFEKCILVLAGETRS